jgi:hypothetical protein
MNRHGEAFVVDLAHGDPVPEVAISATGLSLHWEQEVGDDEEEEKQQVDLEAS